MKLVFMGTPDFAAAILHSISSKHDVLAVITRPDKPAGRSGALSPPPVKRLAEELGVPVLQPTRLKPAAFAASISAYGAELAVVAAYGRVLPASVLTAFPRGCLNVHASLLPKYRGASPIQSAICAGERETGVTIMQMDEGLDTGAVLSQRAIDILPGDTGGTLHERLSALGAALLLDTLANLDNIRPTPQDGRLASHTRVLTKEDGRIDWRRGPREITCRINGLNPWPGAFTALNGKPLKIWQAEAAEGAGQPGEVLSADKRGGLLVACGGGAVRLLEVQAQGGKRLQTQAFLNGYKEEPLCGMILV